MANDRRHIVITGATRGLGRAMAEGFIEAGHLVSGCGTSLDVIEELASRHPEHGFDAVDVADDDAVAQWSAQVVSAKGAPDLLLNNAAIANEPAPLWEIDAEEFDRIIDVNIKGVANVVRHFVPSMIERGTGVIVNFSSGWGRSASADVGPYVTTKFAIEGFSKSLAEDLPKGLASIPLSPGVIDTDMLQTVFGGSASRHQSPDEWAKKAIPFLLALGPRDNGKSLSIR
jgi:NAD(P)-dependent dehydrogenase (short-subunit alcohol dehydrogenase family)